MNATLDVETKRVRA